MHKQIMSACQHCDNQLCQFHKYFKIRASLSNAHLSNYAA